MTGGRKKGCPPARGGPREKGNGNGPKHVNFPPQRKGRKASNRGGGLVGFPRTRGKQKKEKTETKNISFREG